MSAETPKEIVTAGAPAAAPAAPVAPAAPDIPYIEALIEANVQRSLDSLDAWKLTAPFRGDDPAKPADPKKCSKDKHTCNLEAEDISATCVGCVLYRRIVKERSIFPVGGHSGACDYMALSIAEPLIFAFIRNGEWLNPTENLEGRWFVKHPITFVARTQTSMVPATQVAVRRNKIHLFEGDAILARLGLVGRKDTIYARLHDYWHTKAGGIIYSLDELLDSFGQLTQYATNAYRLGINLDETVDIDKLAVGLQGVVLDSIK